MDERIRQLQRQYQAGDTSVVGKLFTRMLAANQIGDSEVRLLAMLGFHPAIEANEGRSPIPTDYLWTRVGKYISLHLIVAAYIYPFRRIFNNQDWCEIQKSASLRTSWGTRPKAKAHRTRPPARSRMWDDEVCTEFKLLVEKALQELESWKPGYLPDKIPFKKLGRRGDHNIWTKRYGVPFLRRLELYDIGRTLGEESREYRLTWHLQHATGQLFEIREIMKPRRRWVDNINTWLTEIETFWYEEAANFELYLLPLDQRPQNVARQQLYNYLLPKALSLILL